MKKIPRLPSNRLLALFAFAALAPFATALVPTEWRQRQTFEVATPGLIKIPLPARTFDAAQPGLGDLRILNAAGQEQPYLVESPPDPEPQPRADQWIRPTSLRETRAGAGTAIVVETGTKDSLLAIELETPTPFFLLAAHAETSADGQEWTSMGPAVPVFRQFGAEQLRLLLNGRPAAFVRVTLDDFNARPVSVSAARIMRAPKRTASPAVVPLGVQITKRDEFAGETVLGIQLDGRNVPLASVGLLVKDPLFMRRVTVSVREVRGTASEERIVGAGTLYRVALEGVPSRAQLSLPLSFLPPARELLVHIHNGDSPPLAIDGVVAEQYPVTLMFMAQAAGSYDLLTGNAQVEPPHYDFAAFAGELRKASATGVSLGNPEPMPNYRARASLTETPLPDIPLTGAPLDTKGWTNRRTIRVQQTGVQELELDPGALARSRSDFGDVRLLHAGNQIPYLVEQPGLARSLTLTAETVKDSKRPTLSLWKVSLPYARLPLNRLLLTSKSPLFQRQLRIYEKISGTDGGTVELTQAAGTWSRTPAPGMPESQAFEFSSRLRTNTLWIETENGDNPAIVLGSIQVTHSVVRVIFKVETTEDLALVYGNKTVFEPHYDLNLVAVKLLTASRTTATLSASDAGGDDDEGSFFSMPKGRLVFWAVLGLVVIVLLVVVAKLLPKPAS